MTVQHARLFRLPGPVTLTARLWHALRRTSESDPLFQRAVDRRQTKARHNWSFSRRLLATALALFVFCGAISLAPTVVWAILFGLLLVVPLVYITLNGTVNGISWSAHIATAIGEERRRGTYDLLCALPRGAAAASWALCAASLRRHGAFGGDDAERVWLLRTLFVMVLISGMLIYAGRPRNWSLESDRVLIAAVNVLALLVAFRMDDIQSVVTSSLIGMLVPTFTREPVDTRLFAILGFLLAQIGGYAAVALLAFGLLPDVLALARLESSAMLVALPLLRLALFYGAREAVNRALWHVLARRFETAPDELRALTGG